MKKILFLLLTLATFFTLVGCDIAVAEWNFTEMEVKSILGGTTTYKDGDSFLVVGKIKAEDYKLVINNDKTLTFGSNDNALSGTWEKEDEVYKLVINDITYEASLVDGQLHLKYNLLGTDVVIKYSR